MQQQIEVLCKCPTCHRTYRQTVRGKWAGATRKVPRSAVAMRALCEDAGQGTEGSCWVGYAYCSECGERKMPPSLRGSVGKWVREGEEL